MKVRKTIILVPFLTVMTKHLARGYLWKDVFIPAPSFRRHSPFWWGRCDFGQGEHVCSRGKPAGPTEWVVRKQTENRKSGQPMGFKSHFLVTYFLQQGSTSCGFHTLPKQCYSRGPSVQTGEPIRDIPHSNSSCCP